MSHQDRTSDIVVNHEAIKQEMDCLLASQVFARMHSRCNATWKPRVLAVTAVLWAMSDLSNLKDRFVDARKITAKIFSWQPPPGATYQGFMKMLKKWHVRLLLAVVPNLRVQMKEVLPGQWMIAGYVIFAGDGSRIELPRTASLEEAFSPKRTKKKKQQRKPRGKQGGRSRRGTSANQRSTKKQSPESLKKKTNSPQMWLTLFWHVGSGLPWAWRTGPSDSSERAHLEEMLKELPENSLITADAGFVGYDFWRAILAARHHFLIRVGSNVRLLRKLGYAREYDHVVYLWPDGAAKKKQPPLKLRLIELHDGKHPVYLVTDLTKTQLSDRQAGTIYAARWGIELFFRTFKQTFGRRKLRSHCPQNAKLELDWSLVAIWCACLAGHRELANNGTDPRRLSPAAVIKAFQSAMRHYRVRPEGREESLWCRLREAILDDYERTATKTSRGYPRKKKRERIGPPKVTKATKQQIDAANELRSLEHEFRLPA